MSAQTGPILAAAKAVARARRGRRSTEAPFRGAQGRKLGGESHFYLYFCGELMNLIPVGAGARRVCEIVGIVGTGTFTHERDAENSFVKVGQSESAGTLPCLVVSHPGLFTFKRSASAAWEGVEM